MGKAVLQDTLATELADLQRRIRTLETTSRLVSSSIKDGALRILDGNGNAVIVIGRLDDDPSYGIEVSDSDGQVLYRLTNTEGQEQPLYYLGASGFFFDHTTTSAAYDELWRHDFWCMNDSIFYDVNVNPDGGTMSWRLRVYESPSGTPTDLVSETGVTAGGQRAGTVAIPASCLVGAPAGNPKGRFLTLRMEALRSAGANPVGVRLNSLPRNNSLP